jgi:hypothetical protein
VGLEATHCIITRSKQSNRSRAVNDRYSLSRLPPLAANALHSGTARSCGHQLFHYFCASSILTPSSHPRPVIPLLRSTLVAHVLSSIAFWPHPWARHNAHRVASKGVTNAAVTALDVVYPFVFGRWGPYAWRPHGQDTRRRCGLGRPNCMSPPTVVV